MDNILGKTTKGSFVGAFCVLKLDELNLFSIKEQSFVYGMKFQLVGHWQFVLHGLVRRILSFWTFVRLSSSGKTFRDGFWGRKDRMELSFDGEKLKQKGILFGRNDFGSGVLLGYVKLAILMDCLKMSRRKLDFQIFDFNFKECS